MKRRGITLIEVLAVVAIVATLSALLFPVFAQAKRKAKEANTLSNLRQCWLALELYADNYGGEQYMPRYNEAVEVTSKAPTCDSIDYWRQSCSTPVEAPMLGSYGYVRGAPIGWSEGKWLDYLNDEAVGKNLLICPFYGSRPLPPYVGDLEPPSCRPAGDCRFPDRLVVVRLDGSAIGRNNHFGGPPPGPGFGFGWSSAFSVRF